MDEQPISESTLQDALQHSTIYSKLYDMLGKLTKHQQKLNAEIVALTEERENILQSLADGLVVTDLQGHIKMFNRTAQNLFDKSFETNEGKLLNDFLHLKILPEPISPKKLETIALHKSQEFPVSINGHNKILLFSVTLMTSEEQEPQGLIINIKDLTNIKRLEQEASRKNRLIAMGQIAMQVAHEIRNPLGSIKLLLSMMSQDVDKDSEHFEYIQHIQSATDSMNHIISNLLEYSRPKPISVNIIDITELMNNFVEFIHFYVEQQTVKLITQLASESIFIKGNTQLLKQACHNLCVNACQAMPESGTLTISMTTQQENDPLILNRLEKGINNQPKEPFQSVRLNFKDTGYGMSQDVKEKLFDPFFTTREQGTGLGLSIVHKTVESLRGTILVESEEEKGTCITLVLPITTNM